MCPCITALMCMLIMQGQAILQYYCKAMILSAMVIDITENFQYQITVIMMLSSKSEAYTLKTSNFLDMWYKFFYHMVTVLVLLYCYNQLMDIVIFIMIFQWIIVTSQISAPPIPTFMYIHTFY